MKRVFLCLLALLMLTGCGSYRETNRLTIVSAGGIERAKDGKVVLTAETVKLSQDSSTPKAALMTATGPSVPAAFYNAGLHMGTDLYWSHAQVMILDETLSKDGISPLLDYLCRNPEIRMSCRLVTSKATAPSDILKPSPLSGEIPGYDLGLLVTRGNDVGFSPNIPLYKLLDTLLSEGVDPVLPAVTIAQGQCLPAGCAVFRKDKLAGFLDTEDTRTLVMLQNGVKGAPLTLEDGTVLRIKKANATIVPRQKDGTLVFDIEITADAQLETPGSKGNSMLAERAEQSLMLQTNKLLKTLQTDLHSDALGLGRSVYRNIPSLWKTIGNDWGTLYPNAQTTVTASVHITGSGLIKTQMGGGYHA